MKLTLIVTSEDSHATHRLALERLNVERVGDHSIAIVSFFPLYLHPSIYLGR